MLRFLADENFDNRFLRALRRENATSSGEEVIPQKLVKKLHRLWAFGAQ